MGGTDTIANVFERMCRGRVLTLFTNDVDRAALAVSECAEEQEHVPTIVLVDWNEAPTLSRELREIEHALADALLSIFPNWHHTAHQKFEFERFPRAELELRLLEAHRASPRVSASWFRKAFLKSQRGKTPLFEDMPLAPQVEQLTLALDPLRPMFCLSVRSDEASDAQVRGLARACEWLARQAMAEVLLIVPRAWSDHRELDPINYAALTLDFERSSNERNELVESLDFEPLRSAARNTPFDSLASPDQARSSTAGDVDGVHRGRAAPRPGSPHVLVLPNPGKPHPRSDAEQRLAEFLARDMELRSLFEFNQLVPGFQGQHFKVDLVWRAGLLVVEVDGDDHRREEKYSLDRDRDYRLFMSGYATLRICNHEVFVDVEHVLSKIRNVVRLRRQAKE